MVPPDRRFRPHEHLRLRADFARVFALRCSVADDVLVVYVAPNNLDASRIGLSVSKRIGNAVARNYVKRRIREAFRLNKSKVPTGLDIICVARAPARQPGSDVAHSLVTLVERARRRLAARERRPIV